MHILKLAAISLIPLSLINNVYADITECIQAKTRTINCPHYVIRSITTDNPRYQGKAICICLTDFSLPKNLTEKERSTFEQNLEQAQQDYQISREDLLALISGK